jgi:hypothetical protein
MSVAALSIVTIGTDRSRAAAGAPPIPVEPVPTGIPAFDRDEWLPAWADGDGDCQATPQEVMIAETRAPITYAGRARCAVVRGAWRNRYNATTIIESDRIAIDHLVPLENAHRSGGWAWPAAEKQAYANDLRHTAVLIAVSTGSAAKKAGRGPDEWKPSDRAYWCTYATNWIKVKQAWQLSATPAEWRAVETMLSTCGGGGTPPPSTTAARLCAAPAPTVQGTVGPTELIETSGVAPSRRHPGILWVHNDSGDTPRVFAITGNGAARGVYPFVGATAFDWEAIAIGPGPVTGVDYLYVGDIGGSALRTGLQVYRAAEPTPSGAGFAVAGVERLELLYPDGPRDAEAMMVDPQTGDLYIVSKVANGASRVYRAAGILGPGPTTLTFVRQLALGNGVQVTAGDISPDGTAVVLRSYTRVQVFARPPGEALAAAFAQAPCDAPSPVEIQGEAMAVDVDNGGFITLSEGWREPIWHVGS